VDKSSQRMSVGPVSTQRTLSVTPAKSRPLSSSSFDDVKKNEDKAKTAAKAAAPKPVANPKSIVREGSLKSKGENVVWFDFFARSERWVKT
jgi:hypothetical protein